MVFQGRPFFGVDIQRIGAMAAAGDWESGEGGSDSIDIVDAYVDRLVEGFAGGAYRIGWDAGNGAAGPVVEKLTARLPGEHHLLYTDVDGHFPNHHHDPTDERHMANLRKLVAERSLDLDRKSVVVGKECVSTCRSRWSQYHKKTKKTIIEQIHRH